MIDSLRRARKLLVWWNPLFPIDGAGRMCSIDSEGVKSYSIWDVIEGPDHFEIDCLLSSMIFGISLLDWETTPGRTAKEVLALFDKAIIRAHGIQRAKGNIN